MAITKKKVSEVSNGIRNVYHKALDVVSKHQREYGIELLKEVVKKDPGFMDARALLRKTEKEEFALRNVFKKFFSHIKIIIPVIKGYILMGKKPLESLNLAEEALSINVKSPLSLGLLRDAGKALNAGFIVMEALEGIVELNETNEANLRALAEVCEAEGEGARVLRIRQQIAAKHPESLEAQADLRAAAALATLEQQNQITGGEFKSVAAQKKKGSSETDVLLRDDRIVRSEDDIRKVIAHYEKKIAEGDESIDNRKKLADYYFRINMHQEAIDTYNWIVQKLGSLDPNIDKSIEKSTIALLNKKIEDIKTAGGSEEDIAAVSAEIKAYRLERAEARVSTFPNDTLLRFELAVLYWEAGEVEKALAAFQIAQKNPQKRLAAFVYLGRCFASKQQFDMAIEQFDKALSEMPVMDDLKMEGLYYKGVTLDTLGDSVKAMDCFKEIYSVNVNYQDVSKRINDFYAAQNAKRQQAKA